MRKEHYRLILSHYKLIVPIIMISAIVFGIVLYFASVSFTEQRYENVNRIYTDDLYGTTIYISTGEQRTEPLRFRHPGPIFITDVSAGQKMWAEHKKCEKNPHGCLELHVRSLDDIEHVVVRETRRSE